jgi:hypothetical protein
MHCHEARFHGALLERGFWIYICVIEHLGEKIIYVGRTGDSSSLNAGSPFLRLTGHLDRKYTAKSATMLKQLTKHGFDVEKCSFELFAFGPFYPEQKERESHRTYRDVLAALERDVADELRKRGYTVVGSHNSKTQSDSEIFFRILNHEKFPRSQIPLPTNRA